MLIKSFPNGISLHLDKEEPFEQVLDEIANKFSEARNFFGKASMALSIEDRKLSAAEEIQILDVIRNNSDLNIVCIVGKDEETNKNFIKALAHTEKKIAEESGQFVKGSLKNKEVFETESSVIILGDVYPGCAVISAKNIIILGGLYGEAYAGGNGKPDAFVAALEMEPERIKIGDFKYKPTGKQPKWGIHAKVQPKIAYVKNKKIFFETLTKDLLGTF